MEVLQRQRAEYRKEILATLSQQSSAEFGRGYRCTGDVEIFRQHAEIVEELDVIEAEARGADRALRDILQRIGV